MKFSKLIFLNRPKNSARKWPKIGQKQIENFLVIKSAIILPKYGQKLAENRPILGPKKPAGLSGFEDRASGGLGPPKKRHGRAGFGLSPRPDPSLALLYVDTTI